jgi:hypothetical protein
MEHLKSLMKELLANIQYGTIPEIYNKMKSQLLCTSFMYGTDNRIGRNIVSNILYISLINACTTKLSLIFVSRQYRYVIRATGFALGLPL